MLTSCPSSSMVLVHLLEDDAALDVDVGEATAAEDLAEQLEPAEQRLGVQRDLVERVVAAGLGVERAAERLDGVVERVGVGQPLGAAKQHVLEEVRQPVVRRRFVARADPRVHDDRDRVQVRQLDRDDGQPIRENVLVPRKKHAIWYHK